MIAGLYPLHLNSLLTKIWLMIAWCLLQVGSTLHAQSDKPYHLNGNAVQEDCNCYTLTSDKNNQSGSVWNINKIDLNQPFDFHFNVFLGCRDSDGADGIAFVLQPLSTSIGTTGQGLGIEGVAPSVAVAIDTYANFDFGDPSYDHVAIHLNGDLNHHTANNIAGPVMALENNENIEDCKWHIIRIRWEPASAKMTVFMDGKERVHTTIPMVQQVFHGDPMVYWGFSGATGGATNHQRFCTSLNPSFSLAPDQITCYPEPVLFTDGSTSFGDIVKWYWDFGDGTTDTVQHPGLHSYPAPGNYTVSLNIVGNDGCLSDTFRQQVVAGSKPIADFKINDPPFCERKWLSLEDQSTVEFGRVQTRIWNIDGNPFTDTGQTFQQLFSPANHTVTLKVATREGCVSETSSKVITVHPRPHISMQDAPDACKNELIPFVAASTSPAVPAHTWHWDFGDGATDQEALATHGYSQAGQYNASVFVLSKEGCASDTLTQELSVFSTNAFAGNDTIIAMGQPLQMQATGGDFYYWSPAVGLSDPNVANPVAIIAEDQHYIVTASSATAGCPTRDSIFVKVYKGPAFYVPSAFTPNGDGKNDRFRFVAAGMAAIHYFSIFNRYGQLVYSSVSPSGWDGSVNGKMQTTGTFVWTIGGKDYLGNELKRKGTVTLIR